MKKKVLALLLAFCMCLSLMPGQAFAVDTNEFAEQEEPAEEILADKPADPEEEALEGEPEAGLEEEPAEENLESNPEAELEEEPLNASTLKAEIRSYARNTTENLRTSELLYVYTEGFSSDATLQYFYTVTPAVTDRDGDCGIYLTSSSNQAIDNSDYDQIWSDSSTSNRKTDRAYFSVRDDEYYASAGKYNPTLTVSVTVTDTNKSSSTYNQSVSTSHTGFALADLKADVGGVALLLYVGDSQDMLEYYGLAGVVHIKCNHSSAEITKIYDSTVATYTYNRWSDTSTVTGVKVGHTQMDITVEKTSSCAHHSNQSASVTSDVYVVAKPTGNNDGEVVLTGVAAGVSYTINGETKTATKDGETLTFTNVPAGTQSYVIDVPGKSVSVKTGTFTMPAVTKYNVNIQSGITNGSVTDRSATTAAKGTTVTFKAVPADNYVVDTITVSYSGGTVTATPTGTANQYSFTMPGAAVTINATFKMHTHVWEYNLDTTTTNEDTIKAHCTDPAHVGEDETLTIIPPTQLEYDGNPKPSTLSGSLTGVTLTNDDIQYYKKNDLGEWVSMGTDKPTEVGDYKAEITGGGKTASTTYTITPKTITDATITGPEAVTYDGTKKTPEDVTVVYQGKTLVKDKDYTLSYPTAADANTNAGTDAGTVTINYIGNYAGSQSKTFTINQAEGSGTVTMEGWKEGETAKDAVTSSTTNTGTPTLYYKVKGADDSTYTTVKPTTAGDYVVKAVFPANNNYKEYAATADFTIAEPDTPSIALEKKARDPQAPKTVYDLGETVVYEITVTNDGKTDLTNVVVTEQEGMTIVANGTLYTINEQGQAVIASLAKEASVTVLVEHVVTSDDILNGAISNTVNATADQVNGQTPYKEITDENAPIAKAEGSFEMVKKVANTPADGTAYKLGETIEYEITVKNTGNVPVDQVVVTEIKGMTIVNDAAYAVGTNASQAPTATITKLDVGQTVTIYVEHAVTEADLSAGKIVNNAEVTGTFQNKDDPSNPNPATPDDAELVVTLLSAEDIPDQTYTGSEIKPALTVKDGDKVLTEGVDYEVTYSNNTDVTDDQHPAVATITFKGDYAGKSPIIKNFNILPREAGNDTPAGEPKAEIEAIPDQTYTGSKIKPALEVSIVLPGDSKATELEEGTDYEVAYSNNVNVTTEESKAVATVTLKGNYKGTLTKEFNILPREAGNDTPAGEPKAEIEAIPDQTYTGSKIKPALEVSIVLPGDSEATGLEEGTDYEVAYSNNVNVTTEESKAVATVTLKGNYKGTLTKEFNILPKAHNDDHDNEKPKNEDVPDTDPDYNPGDVCITADPIPDETFNYDQHKPKPVLHDGEYQLVEGKDYIIEGYTDNVNAGRDAAVNIKFIGNYSGTKIVKFTILPKELNENNVEDIPVQPHTGSEVKPVPEIKDGDYELKEGTDFRLTYEDNTEVGKGKVTVEFIGNYTGEAEKEFNIGYIIEPAEPDPEEEEEEYDSFEVDGEEVEPQEGIDKDDPEKKLIVTDNTDDIVSVGIKNNQKDEDVHHDYPEKLTVDILEFNKESGRYEAKKSFYDLIRYEGTSIRIGGKPGLRIITSISQEYKSYLINTGVEVNGITYYLKEYGTLMAWTEELGEKALTMACVDEGLAKLGVAYDGQKDAIYQKLDGRDYWCNVVTSSDGTFTDEQICSDMTLRPFVKMESEDGHVFYIYGGSVIRSIGSVAEQNENVYRSGSWQNECIVEFVEIYNGKQPN